MRISFPVYVKLFYRIVSYRRPIVKCTKYLWPEVTLRLSCSEPCYYENQVL